MDIDPLRPSGVSCTDEEHELALAKAEEVARWIAGLGFPEPVRADRNGAHLLYRIDLPNDDAATALVKSCLATLDALFSDERVTVDTANFNAARIWKLYGAVSRKGDKPRTPAPEEPDTLGPGGTAVVTIDQLGTSQPGSRPSSTHSSRRQREGQAASLGHWLSDHGSMSGPEAVQRRDALCA